MNNPGELREAFRKARYALSQAGMQIGAALDALAQLESALFPKFYRWRCAGCGYSKHFTKPSTVEACGKCPRCGGTLFDPFDDQQTKQ